VWSGEVALLPSSHLKGSGLFAFNIHNDNDMSLYNSILSYYISQPTPNPVDSCSSPVSAKIQPLLLIPKLQVVSEQPDDCAELALGCMDEVDVVVFVEELGASDLEDKGECEEMFWYYKL